MMPGVETRSIRGLLLFQLSVLFAVGMLALYLAATSYARFAADSSFDRLLLGSAGAIAETLSITPDEVRVDVPYAALDMLAAAPDDRVFYRVIGPDGETVTGYADLPAPPGVRAPAVSSGAPRLFDAPYRGEEVRFAIIGREVRVAGKSGWVWLQVGQTRVARRLLADELTIRAVLPILAMTVLAAVVAWASVGRAVRPLETVGADLTVRSAADLSPIATKVPSEVVPLIEAINQFMARLDSNMNTLRTFIADAAHQLRTPLTALIVQTRSAETNTGRVREDSIAAAGQSATRLARLVDQLLSDAMVAHRAQAHLAAPFDLRRTVEVSLQDCVSLSHDADIRFTTASDSAMMMGDEVMIAEAIKNLLHNALAHGKGDGSREQRVDVFLSREGSNLELTIRDNGPGMADNAIAGLGERFRSQSVGGVGLGLAIAMQVAQNHGGALQVSNVDNTRGCGLQATLVVPA